MTIRLRLIGALLALAAAVPAAASAAAPQSAYIVVLDDAVGVPAGAGSDDAGRAIHRGRAQAAVAADHGAVIHRSFRHALSGFTTVLSATQRARMVADSRVVAVEPDVYEQALPAASAVSRAARVGPTTAAAPEPRHVDDSLRRVAADVAYPGHVNGMDDERPDVDIAILDSGIAPLPDLNIHGGYNCTGSNRSAYGDVYGHGTEVAAVAAAQDNDDGIVGIVPGARLWSVKTITNSGGLRLSMAICAADWVAGQRDPGDSSKPLIEVANMSFTIRSGARSPVDDGACGRISGDLFHRAICRMTAGGTIGVAAAGNHGRGVGSNRPAAFREVVTVSALADFDGRAGGLARFDEECLPEERDEDDTFANFSNYGPAIDLIAPGVCMTMPWIRTDGTLHQQSGTSFASPLVAGTIALYLLRYPDATERQVRQAIRQAATGSWFGGTDPDGRRDRLLNLANLPPPDTTAPAASMGTIEFATGRRAPSSGAPLRVALSASDDRSGTLMLQLQRSVNGGSWTAVSTATASAVVTTVPLGGAVRFRLRATDEAGNTGSWTVSPAVIVQLVDSKSKAFAYSGGWSTVAQSSAYGGSIRRASVAGTRVAALVEARAVAVVVTAGPSRGKARLNVDGAEQVFDTRRSVVQTRRVIAGRSWAGDGPRDLAVIVAGTSGRPRVEFDALLVLRAAP